MKFEILDLKLYIVQISNLQSHLSNHLKNVV